MPLNPPSAFRNWQRYCSISHKRITRPMLGFKAFDTAQSTLVGIELMHRHCQLNGRYPDFLKFPLTPLYEKSVVAHVNSQVFSQFIGGFIIKLTMPPAVVHRDRHGGCSHRRAALCRADGDSYAHDLYEDRHQRDDRGHGKPCPGPAWHL